MTGYSSFLLREPTTRHTNGVQASTEYIFPGFRTEYVQSEVPGFMACIIALPVEEDVYTIRPADACSEL